MGLRPATAALVLATALPVQALAQDDSGDAAAPQPAETATGEVFTPADLARFAPRNALDMLNNVPGFSIVSDDQGRGLGQANTNVLINGERVTSKSESVFDVLRRITIAQVERVEIVDGATLGIPGLSGQVANVIAKGSTLNGRFEYRAIWRPHFAKPSWFGGEISLSGTNGRLEWSAAYSHGTGRGGAGGGEGALITDRNGNLLENRDVLIQFVGEFPRISGRVKWDGPGSLVANFNANYSRQYQDLNNDEFRDLVTGIDYLRDFDNRGRGYSYEIGGDVDFALGPGRLKLIGLDRYGHFNSRSDSINVYVNDDPDTGSRFTTHSDTGEIIGRAEYRWDMIGATWQLDAEAAFNRLDQVSGLFILDPTGNFNEIPFPSASGGVTEDRYEMILNYNDTIAKGWSLQVGIGGEYSKLVQTGPGGLSRTFWRPKGSATLAWTPTQGLDFSLKLARTVGQLSFGDFLASVNLAQNQGNAGNVELVPQQAWELDFEAKKNLKAWGSATLRLYGRWITDFIDIIPVNNFESRGNIEDQATLYGASLTATINLDPIGWQGARLNANARYEDSTLKDPLTREDRPFSGHNYTGGEFSLRYDIPKSDWALGGGFNWSYNKPYVRLFEVGQDYEGDPVYTFGFIENKDVFGLTVNLNVFNMTNASTFFNRTVYTGLRDRSPISTQERRRLNVSSIWRIQVRGNF